MSSYLLAFVVSDFERNSNELTREVGETIHSVYARTEANNKTRFALEHSIAFLNELSRYNSYKFELPRIAHAAIPDFVAGAMENWVIFLILTNLLC